MPDDLDAVDSRDSQDAQHTKDTARDLAKRMVVAARGKEVVEQDTTPVAESDETASIDEAPSAVAEETGELTEATEATEAAEEVAAEEESALPLAEVLTEAERLLAEAGIDLGIQAAELPEELREAYAKLAQSAVDIVQQATDERMEAEDVIRQVREFSDRMANAPDRLLLSLAVTQPAAFKKAVEVFSEMEQDEKIRDMVIRELESEMRLQEVTRREHVLDKSEKMLKARRAVLETRRAAQKHGVPYAVAERVIAGIIRHNNADIELKEIDGIVSELRPAAQAKPKPKVASPKKVAAATAGSRGIAGSMAPPKASPGLNEAVNREKGGGKFRSLIKNAAARLRSQER